MTSVRKSLLLSFVEKYSLLVIQTASTVVLARLLTPAEIGVFSVGTVMVGLTHTLRDFGVSNYLIQEKELTEERVRAALGVTLAIAWGMGLTLLMLSGPAARFYAEPGLQTVIQVLAITFFLFPFSAIVTALLRRSMQFGKLLWINTIGGLLGALVSIGLAATGGGFMSLAWGAVASTVATVAVAVMQRPDKVSYLPSLRGASRVIGYGGRVSGVTLLTTAADAAPDLIIGRVLGFGPVGVFSKAMGVGNMFNMLIVSAAMPVSMPYFAAKVRAGEGLRDAYIHATSLMMGLTWPFLACLAWLAFPVVRLMFGEQWDAAVPIVEILCLAFMFYAPVTFIVPVFLSTGAVRSYLRQNLIIQPSRVALILAASPFGLEAVAWATVAGAAMVLLVSAWHLRRLIGITGRDFARIAGSALPLALLTITPPAVVVMATEATPASIPVQLLLGGAGAALMWLLGLVLFRHPMLDEIIPALERVGLGRIGAVVSRWTARP